MPPDFSRRRWAAPAVAGAVGVAWAAAFLLPPAMGPAVRVEVQDAELSCFEAGQGALVTWGGARCVLTYQPVATLDDPSPAWRRHPSVVVTRFVGLGATVYATEAIVHVGVAIDEPMPLGRLLGAGVAFRHYMRLGGRSQITKQVQLDTDLITHFAETPRHQIDADATWGFDHSIAFAVAFDSGEILDDDLLALAAERGTEMDVFRGPVERGLELDDPVLAAALRCPQTAVRAAAVLVGDAQCALLVAKDRGGVPRWELFPHVVLAQWRGLGLAAGAGGGAMSGEVLFTDGPRTLRQLLTRYEGGTFGVWAGAGEVSVAGAPRGDLGLKLILVDDIPGLQQVGVGVSWNTSSSLQLRDAGVPLTGTLEALALAECGLLGRVRGDEVEDACALPDPLPPGHRRRWEALSQQPIEPSEVDHLLDFSRKMGSFDDGRS